MGASTEIYSNAINRTAFSAASVVKHYDGDDYLFESEELIFKELLPVIKNAAILDLGIGAGRTTKYLLEISRNYTGLDYVPEFIERARKKFPMANLVVGDATDLRPLADESFDFVLFSYNGLGCISHEGRLKALHEIHRVLRRGGRFMFSAHNREYKNYRKLPWRRKFEWNMKFARFMLYALYHLPRHWKMKRFEIETDYFALVNDSDHRYSLLFYYISPEKQVSQLRAAGFTDIRVYDPKGKRVDSCPESHWLEYVAVKE
jgi:ubiquinone/menaquinone biosynthesis C-methylase UbiE